jgi:hypothetical protein
MEVLDMREMSSEEITRLYGALRSELNSLPVQAIRNTVAAAGFDVSKITAEAEARSGLGSRAEVMPAVDKLFGKMQRPAQEVALRILAERLIGKSEAWAKSVQEILGRHGYQFVAGSFVPVDLLDMREARFLPASASAELARATARLMDGDDSGAITSACGAVDLVTQQVYEKQGMGDPGKVAFQAKVNTALKQLHVFEDMKRDFQLLGMKPDDASSIIDDLRQAANHAAQALQILRLAMGDTHGSKPALRSAAYDAIKWASAICGLLEGKI